MQDMKSQLDGARTNSKMSYKPLLIVSGAGGAACIVLALIRGLYIYWADPKVVNFLAAWIPFVISVFVAFVPDHEMSKKRKVLWRASVIAIGFLWSGVLWHQQIVDENAVVADQSQIVIQANKHSDAQFGEVERDLHDTRSDLESRIDKVPSLLSATESHLDVSIGKVGTAPRARLQVSFWPHPGENMPVDTAFLSPLDGVYQVPITVKNISDTEAKDVDLWVTLCDACSFAQEPVGFDRPQGMNELTRHKSISSLNPGVTFEKTVIPVELPLNFQRFVIGVSYSCATCGKASPTENLTIISLALRNRYTVR